MNLRSAVIAVAAIALVAGCAHHKSVLNEGLRGNTGRVHRVSEPEARAAGMRTLAIWKGQLVLGARQHPHQRFQNPSPAKLRQGLADLAQSKGFKVVSVEILRPRQLAPEIVVETRHYRALAHATPAILLRLDARWSYEGFYFEARDEHHVPFLIVYNFRHGRGINLLQWARSDPLYAFEPAY